MVFGSQRRRFLGRHGFAADIEFVADEVLQGAHDRIEIDRARGGVHRRKILAHGGGVFTRRFLFAGDRSRAGFSRCRPVVIQQVVAYQVLKRFQDFFERMFFGGLVFVFRIGRFHGSGLDKIAGADFVRLQRIAAVAV
ncbi:MAG: hypothetical protein NUV34_05865, partial [Sulfuricaulis sp.]|nr:hypothetical protein [Sulfuricaulis sp.]